MSSLLSGGNDSGHAQESDRPNSSYPSTSAPSGPPTNGQRPQLTSPPVERRDAPNSEHNNSNPMQTYPSFLPPSMASTSQQYDVLGNKRFPASASPPRTSTNLPRSDMASSASSSKQNAPTSANPALYPMSTGNKAQPMNAPSFASSWANRPSSSAAMHNQLPTSSTQQQSNNPSARMSPPQQYGIRSGFFDQHQPQPGQQQQQRPSSAQQPAKQPPVLPQQSRSFGYPGFSDQNESQFGHKRKRSDPALEAGKPSPPVPTEQQPLMHHHHHHHNHAHRTHAPYSGGPIQPIQPGPPQHEQPAKQPKLDNRPPSGPPSSKQPHFHHIHHIPHPSYSPNLPASGQSEEAAPSPAQQRPLFTLEQAKQSTSSPAHVSIRSTEVLNKLPKTARSVGSATAPTEETIPYLGSFLWDPNTDTSALLDGDLLSSNIGGRVRVCVDTRWLSGLTWSVQDPSTNSESVKEAKSNDEHRQVRNWTIFDTPPFTERKIWGTEICTDDSDPLVMALHSGWLRIDLTPTVEEQGKWLEIVLRVAPRLIRYEGSLRGGTNSRSWGNGHDGVSLVVEKVHVSDVSLVLYLV